MKKLFQRRRQDFISRCLKYSRYVLNDHFVLVLLVFLGFLSLQYRQLLDHFPANPWAVYLLLVAVSLLLFFAGQAGTYLEPADQQFLLTKEQEVVDLVKAAGQRQGILWGLLQLAGQCLLFPLYLKLGMPVWAFLLYLFLLTLGKYLFIQGKLQTYQVQAVFQWEVAIRDEVRRRQSILQFFALFTTVKGITSSVKRRAYLDWLLGLVAKKSKNTWEYLYLRAFLRSGDFLGLTVRLFFLSLVALVTIEIDWLASGLVLLLDYLLLFQLLSLFRVYDYQYLSQLYPVTPQRKLKSFQRFLSGLLYGLVALQLLCGFFFLEDKVYLLFLLVGAFILNPFYLSIKGKKLID